MSVISGIALRPSERSHLFDILRNFSKARILVLGDFILDQFVWGKVERISPEAPVPVVSVSRESYMPGGSLNASNNVHSLGGTVYPCGIVGRDLTGRVLVRTMRREGIDTDGVIYDSTRPTSIKTRIIAHSQQVVRFDREKSSEISKKDCDKLIHYVEDRINAVNVIVIEDYGKGVVQPYLLKNVLKIAKKFKTPVLVDPKEKHFSYYAGVTAITPNRVEAFNGVESLGGRAATIEDAGKFLLRKLKCEAVLITLGEDGMALFEKGGAITRIPTTAREVFDVSGAGDTVVAVLALALASKATMKEAALISNLAAGIVVGKLGTATVSVEELRKSLEKN